MRSGILSILSLIALWELSYLFIHEVMVMFPPPSVFGSYLIENDFAAGIGPEQGNILDAVLASAARVIVGLGIALIGAVTVGISISFYPSVRSVVLPIIRLFAPVAPIAWIPLALAVFGIGNISAVFIVVLGTFFILVIATVSSIDGVDPRYLDIARSLGASKAQIWLYVILPAILPEVFLLLRLNFTGAWMAVLAAEMVGLRDGLGALILIGRESFNPNLIMIGMVLIGLTGFLIDQALLRTQQRYLWWQQQ